MKLDDVRTWRDEIQGAIEGIDALLKDLQSIVDDVSHYSTVELERNSLDKALSIMTATADVLARRYARLAILEPVLSTRFIIDGHPARDKNHARVLAKELRDCDI
jgi:hypothetical protein